MSRWQTVKLKEVGEVVTGRTPNPETLELGGLGLPFVTPGDLDKSQVLLDSERTVTDAGISQVRVLPQGSLLISCIGNIGKMAITGVKVATNQQINAVIWDSNRIDSAYGYLACRLATPQLVAFSSKALLPIINKSKTESIQIYLPPLTEQRRIVAEVEARRAETARLRAALTAQLVELAAIDHAAMNDAYQGAWPTVSLAEVLTSAQPGIACGDRDLNGVRQLRMNNVNLEGEINWDEFITIPANDAQISKYALAPGDIVFCNTNSVELVGKCAMVRNLEVPTVYSNHFNRLRFNQAVVIPEWIEMFLRRMHRAGYFADICTRWVGQAAVRMEHLLPLELGLPSMAEQRRIVAEVEAQRSVIARLRATVGAQLADLSALDQAVLREAFV